MARLFIRHKPTDADVIPNIGNTAERAQFHLAKHHIEGLDLCYVCFVDKGRCWAARKMFQSNGSASVAISCVPFNDDPSGQEMILADMLLN